MGCQGKATETKPAKITFNKFEIGTTSDSIIYGLGFKPNRRTPERLEFMDVTFEGVRGDGVTYDVPGDRLTGGTFTLHSSTKANYDTLYNRYTTRYGKPQSQENGITTWEDDKASLNLMKMNEGGLSVIMSRKTPNR